MDAKELEMPQTGNKRKPLPIVMAFGPQEYLPGKQKDPVLLTTVADMLQWVQNWARSRSIWPFMYALACCGMEMVATASAPQYDLARFGSCVTCGRACTFIPSSLLMLASLPLAHPADDTMSRSDAGPLDGEWVFHQTHGYICPRQSGGVR